jgi:UDPglucose 6-dehydrogenase
MKRITVIGSGYVGTAISCYLSSKNNVIVIDNNEEIVHQLSNQISHIEDKEIAKYLKRNKNNLKFSSDLNFAISNSDLYILCLPTNFSSSENKFDTGILESTIKKLNKLDPEVPILIKSTVPVHFTDTANKKFKRKDIIFSPEFLREGSALYDCFYPDRIIVGASNSILSLEIVSLFTESAKNNPQIFAVPPAEAESIKLFSNSYLAMRVAFFNELDSFCLSNSINTKDIIDGICSDKRIGNKYNNPSFGYGGYCLPKDTKQLISQFADTPNSLINSIVMSNTKRKNYIASFVMEKNPKVLGIYRLQMKEGSDNMKESSVIDIIRRIKKQNIPIIIYEPLINNRKFMGLNIIQDFDEFVSSSSLILANRYNQELEPFLGKIFTRDIFQEN